MKYTDYEQGRWNMFIEISSAWYGKQCYFEQDNNTAYAGLIYSRLSGHYLFSREDAIKEFLNRLWDE